MVLYHLQLMQNSSFVKNKKRNKAVQENRQSKVG